MKVLVTTSQSLLLVDTESGKYRPIDRGHGMYYGMAVHEGQLYVAARNQLLVEKNGHRGDGEILIFDSSLRRAGSLVAPFQLRDMHEIAWHGGVLWVTCPADSMVAMFDGTAWEQWYPLGAQQSDVHHFNSLMIDDGRAWVLAHNWGSSELLSFSRPDMALTRRIGIGMDAHNIRRHDGQLIICSSRDGLVLGTRGFKLDTGGWPRGIVCDGDARCVGVSALAERSGRDLAAGRLLVFDVLWALTKEIGLPSEGMVLDLLRLPAGFTLDV